VIIMRGRVYASGPAYGARKEVGGNLVLWL